MGIGEEFSDRISALRPASRLPLLLILPLLHLDITTQLSGVLLTKRAHGCGGPATLFPNNCLHCDIKRTLLLLLSHRSAITAYGSSGLDNFPRKQIPDQPSSSTIREEKRVEGYLILIDIFASNNTKNNTSIFITFKK